LERALERPFHRERFGALWAAPRNSVPNSEKEIRRKYQKAKNSQANDPEISSVKVRRVRQHGGLKQAAIVPRDSARSVGIHIAARIGSPQDGRSIIKMPMMNQKETSLDPSDWAALARLGHEMVDDMMAYLAGVRDRKAWAQVPPSSVDAIRGELPTTPQGFEATYADFKAHVLPYPNGNIHPRFWGWVQGTGTPYAMLADMLASGMNPHMAGFNQAPAVVEETVIDWLKELMGFPKDASGLLTSGGTMANLTGLAVARKNQVDFDVREKGLQEIESPLTVYASSETHKWAKASMELLGFGSRYLRTIGVNDGFQIDLARLKRAIASDRQGGLTPVCIIGNCGTVNTGAIDDLEGLAVLAEEENLWFHVDGAFGALAYLSPEHSHLVRGLQKAHSLAFDLHKWMYLPFEAGCVLVRPPGAQERTFRSDASYLQSSARGVCSGPLQFADLGIELTRGFKALKVWMSLKAHGTRAFGELIGQNIEQCAYLARLVERSDHLKLLAPVNLNVVCFRFERSGIEETRLDTINEEILLRLQENGIAVLSGTRIRGAYALRVANVNQRTLRRDFEILVREVENEGQRLLSR
jgi:glutamate/tyrosine decarboxylase-like PLP-dependent enzyme